MNRIPKSAVCAALLAGGLITLLAASRPWVGAELDSVVGAGKVEVSGRVAAPLAAGLGLVVLADAVLLAVSGRRVRTFALVVGLLAGAGIAGAAVAVLVSPAETLLEPARLRTGASNALDALVGVEATFWPVVAVVGGLVSAVGSGVGLGVARSWPEAGRRYERAPEIASGASAETPGSSGPVDPLDAWQALTHGSDPTLGGDARAAQEPAAGDAGPPGTIMERG